MVRCREKETVDSSALSGIDLYVALFLRLGPLWMRSRGWQSLRLGMNTGNSVLRTQQGSRTHELTPRGLLGEETPKPHSETHIHTNRLD